MEKIKYDENSLYTDIKDAEKELLKDLQGKEGEE